MLVDVVIDETREKVSTDLVLMDIREEYPEALSVLLETDGTLTVYFPNTYCEYYIARVQGCGTNNNYWGNWLGGFEFVGSKQNHD